METRAYWRAVIWMGLSLVVITTAYGFYFDSNDTFSQILRMVFYAVVLIILAAIIVLNIRDTINSTKTRFIRTVSAISLLYLIYVINAFFNFVFISA